MSKLEILNYFNEKLKHINYLDYNLLKINKKTCLKLILKDKLNNGDLTYINNIINGEGISIKYLIHEVDIKSNLDACNLIQIIFVNVIGYIRNQKLENILDE